MLKVAFSLFSNINNSACSILDRVLNSRSCFDGVLSKHHCEFAIHRKIFPKLTRCLIVLLTYTIGIGWFWELCPRYIKIPLAISLCRYGFDINHHIGFLGVMRGQLFNLQNSHDTDNSYSCPRIREDNYRKSAS